ncbi:MAG: cellulase family glycosylhydrolase [Candidatus Promineifilaceae bacterium]
MDRHYRTGCLVAALFIGLGLLLFAFWPAANSLYDLTGEEDWKGQLAGVVHWLNTAIRPQPDLALELLASDESQNPFGVNSFLQQEVESEKRVRSLEMAHDAGFRFIRQEFQWEDIEIHAEGDFIDRRNDPEGVDAWEKYDQIVDQAQQSGIEIIARISNPPSWSREQTDEIIGALAPPDNYQDFADFAAAVADRYIGRIRYYQIWNEPNGNDEWGLQDVNPEAYTELLCLAYKAIKDVDPDALVLAGALTPTLAMDGRNMNDLIYLQRMYNAGAGECFDIMSAQGYGLWSGAADQRLRPTVINLPHHLFLRDLMVKNNDGQKPIWISEMGWNVVPEGMEARFGRVTEAQQATYTVEAYERIKREWPWVGVANYWYLKRPSDVEKDQSWYYFRLLEPDFTPLPVYDALVAYNQAAPEIEAYPEWLRTWQNLRPFLFFAGAALSFFSLLMILEPKVKASNR